MKTFTIVALVIAIGALALPASSWAAVYEYVTTAGQFKTVTADNAAQALLLPIDRDPSSGVILVTNPSNPPIPTSMTVQNP